MASRFESDPPDRDGEAVAALSRVLYLHYCKEKGFDPYPAPWSPRWAMDYARIAISTFGYDESDLNELNDRLAGAA